GIPWAPATGLTAVELAANGFTGPVDLLDDDARYDQGVLTEGLGQPWRIEDVYFKLYSCCRWAHAAIDGMLEIRAQEQVAADDIVAVRIETFAQTLALNNDLVPPTLEAAQYSVPFCVAAAAVHGPAALLPLEETALADRALLECARKITVTVDPALDPLFPAAVPARVIVETRGARFSRMVLAPRGEPSNPLDWDDLRAKFEALATNRLAPGATTALIDPITSLHGADLLPLLSALSARSEPARVPPSPSALVRQAAAG